jgi:hypothetical protein
MRRQKRAIVFTLAGLLLLVIGLTQSQGVTSACSHVQTELVGWWMFDDGGSYDGGSNVVKDSSTYANDGKLVGLAAFTTDALVGSAVDFTIFDDGVHVPYDKSLEPATGTFGAWIKVSEPQDSDIIEKRTGLAVRSGEAGMFSVYGLRITFDGAIMAYVMNDDPDADNYWTFAESKPGLITLGEWHHLVMRWDGTKLDLFVDGKKQDTVPYNPIPGLGLSYHDSGYFGLGLGTFWSGAFGHDFIGQLDDVRLFNGPRSNWQIRTDYRLRGDYPSTYPGKRLGYGKVISKEKKNLLRHKLLQIRRHRANTFNCRRTVRR